MRYYSKLEGENPKSFNNKVFSEYIKSFVNKGLDALSIARLIYLKLCEVLEYDTSFMAKRQDITDPKAREVYEKKAIDITLDNNKLVCSTWADIYCNLLNDFNIKAVVSGKFHKYVTFKVGSIIVTADATEAHLNQGECCPMNDFTRVKMGIKTAGFKSEIDLEPLTEKIDYYLDQKKKVNDLKEICRESGRERVLANG